MPIDQYSTLLTLLPEIESTLNEKGVAVPRPDYATLNSKSDAGNSEEDSTDELSAAHHSRKNIEATSDEDECEE